MKIAILGSENPDSGQKWMLACRKKGIDASFVDLCSVEALAQIIGGGFNLCLLRPPGLIEKHKAIYDEKLYHIAHILKIPCFPGFLECFIYENKKSLAAFLQAAGIAHPQTWVICHKAEASEFIKKCGYPLVAKTSIGATGSGVRILWDHHTAEKYVKQAFMGKGIRKRSGPNRHVGTPRSWLKKAIADPGYLTKRLKHYLVSYKETQKGYVIFQEYIQHDYEWRVVRIGESYFAYKKYKVGDMASGAKNLGYGNPPFALLTWIKEISDNYNIHTAAFDVFENSGKYLINEIQTIFGHTMDHILEVDGKPGRYLYHDGEWIFEKGMFNLNESYDLRLETALKLYKQGTL